MAKTDLTTLEGIREACQRIEGATRATVGTQQWMTELGQFISWIGQADQATRATVEFQIRLWDGNPVSSLGQGNISVTAAIDDDSFRTWLAHESASALPSGLDERESWLTRLYEGLVERLTHLGIVKTPHLKIFRVLAALFPESLTTVAHRRRLRELYDRMGGPSTQNSVARHIFVRNRIDAALGSPAEGNEELAWRMAIAWYLYEELDAEVPEEDRVATLGPIPETDKLRPLPAARRRRGLTGIRGYFSALPSILESVREGLSRDELLDSLRATFSGYKDSSLVSVINTLRGELALIKQNGNEYRLTSQGEDVLESGDAAELGPWLLTRILGIDHVLKTLLDTGPQKRADLVSLLQRVWPGWTTAYAPNSLLSWLVSFKAIGQASDGTMTLAPLGSEWAARIYWEPEFLVEEVDEPAAAVVPAVANGHSSFRQVGLAEIRNALRDAEGYPDGTIDALHLGLWSPPVRHFAILTGISGSGKTRLAKRYAEVLTQTVSSTPDSRFHIEPVQPAWYDPTPLLGYVSPLKASSYVRTGFLNFLLRASGDPSRPYVAILDEMNLSHPEQYFAPILSAMETGGELRFHAEGEIFDGVPETIPYPRNLAIIGTINMDETTHGLSDKVLDRAFVLEFTSVDMGHYPGWKGRDVPSAARELITRVLTELLRALAPVRMHFGWRVIDDVVDFVCAGLHESSSGELPVLLDTAVYSKVIPKLRGEDNEPFRQALTGVQRSLETHGLPRSRGRVQNLIDDLSSSGTARFWR